MISPFIFLNHKTAFKHQTLLANLNMCIGCNEQTQAHKLHFFPRKPKRIRVRVLSLSGYDRRKPRDVEKAGTDMELQNLKLYMENISILEENEKLRKKACLLHQENLSLMSEFRKRFSKCEFVSMILNTHMLSKEQQHVNDDRN
ncbi:protein LITTLE ZIPPER 2-like isoform X2 [Sesamum indicum]|uniref:Protein LITTLE ZIPPER 2-like isoform X2 n=1 Tax=Sesamum indicum TaxID=4182 RepID=A0A6I9SK74_SESIN|nr:protein LITTLE ZIPPER 2-like isoform X2 [Sesamum indicum]